MCWATKLSRVLACTGLAASNASPRQVPGGVTRNCTILSVEYGGEAASLHVHLVDS